MLFLPSAHCFLPSAFLEAHVLFRRACFALVAGPSRVVELFVELDQRLNGHTFNLIRSRSEAHDRATADDGRTQAAHEFDRLFNRVTAANDVVDDNARIDVALVHILAKHALAVLLLGPVNLLRAQRVAHAESNWNSAGTRTDRG